MTLPTDTGSWSLGDYLRKHQGELLSRWLKAVRACAPAMHLPDSAFVDHLPTVLARVAEAADRIARGDWSKVPGDAAFVHSMSRLGEGFELRDVVTEFFLLRQVLLEAVLSNRTSPDPANDAQLVCWAVDTSIRESVAAYTIARQRALQALDRIATEALSSRTLEELFPRLLRAVLESSSEVDVACILLAEGERLVHRAAVGPDHVKHEKVSIAFGEGITGQVAATGNAMMASSTSHDESAEGVFLQARGIRALYAVPLINDGSVSGVVQMGAASVDAFSQQEVALLSAVADRIGAAVHQHRLREQTERMAAELREANEKLREADHRKNEFLGMLSHELRNPLAPIRNSLYILDRAPPGGDAARRAQAVIDRQVGHLARLIDDLLDVTRITRGKIRLLPAQVDLAEIVRRTIEDHRTVLENHEIEVTLPRTPVWVHGDATRLAQILGNLLQNAAKFTPVDGKIGIALSEKEGQAVLEVSDTGIGMDPETLTRLFQPFSQADRSLSRSMGGLGLGLALVKGLVELHGGRVTAHSEGPGKGARLTVRIPTSAAHQSGAHHAKAKSGTPRKVLVVEDNRDSADSLAEALRLSGHEVAVVYDGEAALERERELRPDVVICDIGLPGMDGFSVATALRNEPSIAGVQLIALTGYAQPEDERRALGAGFNLHLAKPPDLRLLERALESAGAPDAPGQA